MKLRAPFMRYHAMNGRFSYGGEMARRSTGPTSTDRVSAGQFGSTRGSTDGEMRAEDGESDLKPQALHKKEELQASASETMQDLTAKGRETAAELKDEVREQVEQLKDQAEEQVDKRTSQAAGRLDSVVRALENSAGQLSDDGERWLADHARQAAGQIARFAGYLRDEDARSMMRDLEEMARSNTGTFLGTSFAAGLAVGRFLRSSDLTNEAADGLRAGADVPALRGDEPPSVDSWPESGGRNG